MKTLILLPLLFSVIIVRGQELNNIDTSYTTPMFKMFSQFNNSFNYNQNTIIFDSIGTSHYDIDTTISNLCKERGHVCSDIISSTEMYCPSYIIDTDSTTIEVFPACNYITYICKRCRKEITERNKERKVVLWKK